MYLPQTTELHHPSHFSLILPEVSPFGAKLPVPALVPSTAQQLRDFEAAGLRRANRLEARRQQPLELNKLRDADALACADAHSAAAIAAASSRSLVACSSTGVTQVQSQLAKNKQNKRG